MALHRFTDDLPLARRGSQQPNTVPALLRSLNLDRAPEKTQAAALFDWLADHKPSATLKRSLERHGYASMLVDRYLA